MLAEALSHGLRGAQWAIVWPDIERMHLGLTLRGKLCSRSVSRKSYQSSYNTTVLSCLICYWSLPLVSPTPVASCEGSQWRCHVVLLDNEDTRISRQLKQGDGPSCSLVTIMSLVPQMFAVGKRFLILRRVHTPVYSRH